MTVKRKSRTTCTKETQEPYQYSSGDEDFLDLPLLTIKKKEDNIKKTSSTSTPVRQSARLLKKAKIVNQTQTQEQSFISDSINIDINITKTQKPDTPISLSESLFSGEESNIDSSNGETSDSDFEKTSSVIEKKSVLIPRRLGRSRFDKAIEKSRRQELNLELNESLENLNNQINKDLEEDEEDDDFVHPLVLERSTPENNNNNEEDDDEDVNTNMRVMRRSLRIGTIAQRNARVSYNGNNDNVMQRNNRVEVTGNSNSIQSELDSNTSDLTSFDSSDSDSNSNSDSESNSDSDSEGFDIITRARPSGGNRRIRRLTLPVRFPPVQLATTCMIPHHIFSFYFISSLSD